MRAFLPRNEDAATGVVERIEFDADGDPCSPIGLEIDARAGASRVF
jgi:hypothetical protein